MIIKLTSIRIPVDVIRMRIPVDVMDVIRMRAHPILHGSYSFS